MVRIDPIRMLDAYRATGLLPIRTAGFLYADLDARLHACPLAAVSLAQRGATHDQVLRHANLEGGLVSTLAFLQVMTGSSVGWAPTVILRTLGLSQAYMSGYVWGYDRWPLDPYWVEPWHPDYDLGFADGALCHAVLDAMNYQLGEI